MMRFFFILLIYIVFSSCQNQELFPKKYDQAEFLFLGHTYDFHNWKKVDKRLENIDYKQFKGIWLGGDVTSETTKEKATLDYLNDLFNIENPYSHWAVGNHDTRNGNLEFITETTKRPLFYAAHHHGMTVVVLHTGLDGNMQTKRPPCDQIEAQHQFFQSVLDTIQSSSYLVILTHEMIWGLVPEFKRCYQKANQCRPNFAFSCEEKSNFFPNIYNQLKSIQEKGIEVLVVSGDAGMNRKKIYHQTPDDIHFFMVGMNESLDLCKAIPMYHKKTYNDRPDSALIFRHFPLKRQLEWEFKAIKDLVK